MQNFSKELALSLLGSNDEFPIDFDDAMQWWDCRTKNGLPTLKRQLVEKLKQVFDQGIDWTFAENYEKPLNGRPVDKILMTIGCFKEMGMMLPNGKGKEIRRYFLECEKELEKIKSTEPKQAIAEPPSVQQIAEMVATVLGLTPLDRNLIAASAANHIAKHHPILRPVAEDLKKELVVEVSEKLLTPTELGVILKQRTGQIYSAQRVNKLLVEKGLQIPNPNGKDPAWVATPKGSEFSKLLLAAQKGSKDATRQHLQWYESVVEILKEA